MRQMSDDTKSSLAQKLAAIPLDALVATMREIALENPDSKGLDSGLMEECAYFRADGTPSCGVGHAFAAHGVTLEDLDSLEIAGNRTSIDQLYYVTLGVDVAVIELRWLTEFQDWQDRGAMWGDAARWADSIFYSTNS